MDDFQKAEIMLEDAESLRDMDLKLALEMLKEAYNMAPDYPNLANKIFLLESSLEEMNKTRDRLLKMYEDGEYYKALELLNNMPLGYTFSRKEEISKKLKENLRQTEDLLTSTSAVSQQDLSKKMDALKSALALTPDFPGIREKMQEIEKDIEQFKASIEQINSTIKTGDTKEAQELLDSLGDKYLKTGTLYELQEKITRRIKARKKNLALILILIFVMSFSITYGAYELRSIKKAQSTWEEVAPLINEENFEDAHKKSLEILATLVGTRLLWQSQKKELSTQVTELLNSDSFTEGLKGNILFEGRYIPKAAVLNTGSMNRVVSEADHFLKTERFEEAIKAYQNALIVSATIKSEESSTTKAAINTLIKQAQLGRVNKLIKDGDRLYDTINFDAAVGKYQEAARFLKKDNIEDPSILRKIDSSINRAHLASLDGLISTANRYYNSLDYDSAIDQYNKALSFATTNKIATQEIKNLLAKNINITKLDKLISSGDHRFRLAEWESAIEIYEQAIKFAEKNGLTNTPSIKQTTQRLAESKLSRTISICNKLDQEAEILWARNEFAKVMAQYQHILTAIKSSAYSTDSKLKEIQAETLAKMVKTDRAIFLDGKKVYLAKNYESIMRRAFNLSSDASFLNLEIILLSDKDNKLLYNISAFSYEKKNRTGKYSRYEIQYLYDTDTDSWQLTKKNMSSTQKEDVIY
ncbi:MAG: hypothetical protein KKB30_00485 [Proteobacteria bacterium]|nr:hypothetical protein [Pseudomonadota bacterium]MBU1715292.1 hypothetical protein [Pseudomonadota bacterium]